MRDIRDILIFFFRQDLRDCRDVFLVFSFGQGSCGNWLRVAGTSSYGLRVAGVSLLGVFNRIVVVHL